LVKLFAVATVEKTRTGVVFWLACYCYCQENIYR